MAFKIVLSLNDKVVSKCTTSDPIDAKSFLSVMCIDMHEALGTIKHMDFDIDKICTDAWDPRKGDISIERGEYSLVGWKA